MPGCRVTTGAGSAGLCPARGAPGSDRRRAPGSDRGRVPGSDRRRVPGSGRRRGAGFWPAPGAV